jgi:hypothetical protein
MHLLGSKAQNIISICFSSEMSRFSMSAIPSGIALILQASEYVGHLTHTHFFRLDLVLATVPIYIPPVVFDHLNTDAANEIIANIINIITSHFAISMEKPATPCAPNIYATKAITRNTIAALIKSTIH